MKMLFLAVMLLAAAPAYAWRTGVGVGGGLIEGEPAATLFLDLNPGPYSHLHVQPRYQLWKPEGREGIAEVGIDLLYHLSPCHHTSFYVGYGVGVEWETGRDCCPTPTPGIPTPEPPKPDPPIGVGIVGIRFLPSQTVDFCVEARGTATSEDPRGGVFAKVIVHERRK